jgi:hypothetical protein
MIAPPLMTVPECARLAGISVRRMRTIIKTRRQHDPDLVHGTERRPLIQRDALARLLGHSALSVEQRIEDLDVRVTLIERKIA